MMKNLANWRNGIKIKKTLSPWSVVKAGAFDSYDIGELSDLYWWVYDQLLECEKEIGTQPARVKTLLKDIQLHLERSADRNHFSLSRRIDV